MVGFHQVESMHVMDYLISQQNCPVDNVSDSGCIPLHKAIKYGQN